MFKLFEKFLANIALVSAGIGSGFASTWSIYQPKEPKSMNKR